MVRTRVAQSRRTCTARVRDRAPVGRKQQLPWLRVCVDVSRESGTSAIQLVIRCGRVAYMRRREARRDDPSPAGPLNFNLGLYFAFMYRYRYLWASNSTGVIKFRSPLILEVLDQNLQASNSE